MNFNLLFIGYTQDGEKLTEKILDEYENCEEKTPLKLSAEDKCDIIDNYPEIVNARIMFVDFEAQMFFILINENGSMPYLIFGTLMAKRNTFLNTIRY